MITSSQLSDPHLAQAQNTRAKSDRPSLESASRISPPQRALRCIDHTLDLHGRKMAVVNLEAALTNWKLLQADTVASVSRAYRLQVSSSIRITPKRIGGLPSEMLHRLFPFNPRKI